MPSPPRHGPARRPGVVRPGGRPVRRRDGLFAVAGPVAHLATGRVLVGCLPDGTAVAVPSVYVGHLRAGVDALRNATNVGEARDLPWPLRGLAAHLDVLPDHAPLPHDWLDRPRRDGWRAAVPWQLDAGPLGYGRWLPADVVASGLRVADGLRHLVEPPAAVLGALRWHGCPAEEAGPALDEVLLGWTTDLPGRPVLRRWSEDDVAAGPPSPVSG